MAQPGACTCRLCSSRPAGWGGAACGRRAHCCGPAQRPAPRAHLYAPERPDKVAAPGCRAVVAELPKVVGPSQQRRACAHGRQVQRRGHVPPAGRVGGRGDSRARAVARGWWGPSGKLACWRGPVAGQAAARAQLPGRALRSPYRLEDAHTHALDLDQGRARPGQARPPPTRPPTRPPTCTAAPWRLGAAQCRSSSGTCGSTMQGQSTCPGPGACLPLDSL
jgi:hypothetical protein